MQPVNSFWSYLMPLFGAFVADQYLGRFRTIMWSIVVAMVGHNSAGHLGHSSSHRASIRRSCVFFHWIGDHGCWNGWLQVSTPSPALTAWCNANPSRANISPLIAEQYQLEAHVRTLSSGERVLVDPNATIARSYLYFYLMINVGSLIGSISMVYAERYVGFLAGFPSTNGNVLFMSHRAVYLSKALCALCHRGVQCIRRCSGCGGLRCGNGHGMHSCLHFLYERNILTLTENKTRISGTRPNHHDKSQNRTG